MNTEAQFVIFLGSCQATPAAGQFLASNSNQLAFLCPAVVPLLLHARPGLSFDDKRHFFREGIDHLIPEIKDDAEEGTMAQQIAFFRKYKGETEYDPEKALRVTPLQKAKWGKIYGPDKYGPIPAFAIIVRRMLGSPVAGERRVWVTAFLKMGKSNAINKKVDKLETPTQLADRIWDTHALITKHVGPNVMEGNPLSRVKAYIQALPKEYQDDLQDQLKYMQVETMTAKAVITQLASYAENLHNNSLAKLAGSPVPASAVQPYGG